MHAARWLLAVSGWMCLGAVPVSGPAQAFMAQPAVAVPVGEPVGPQATLDRPQVEAKGRSAALLTVKRFGRYAVTVKSAQGVALQLVDRMAGPGETSGVAGKEDGRLDVFLDRGEYRLITSGHEQAQGMAQLAVHSFAELGAPAPQLVELKTVSESLGDLEQRSYWVQIASRRWVHLEAAGRNLRDMRLWRDGTWLADAKPAAEIIEPRPGQPLLSLRLTAELDPGLYLLTAYGGIPQPWSEQGEQHPFYLRWGIPKLAMAGRAHFEASPFGVDRRLVPAEASYFRLELPEAKPAELWVEDFKESEPLHGFGTPVPPKETEQPAEQEAEAAASTEAGAEEEAAQAEDQSSEETQSQAEPQAEQPSTEKSGEEAGSESGETASEPAAEQAEAAASPDTPQAEEQASPEAASSSAEAQSAEPQSAKAGPADVPGLVARIRKDSRVPVAEVETPSRNNGLRVIAVHTSPGQPYVLQHFNPSHEYRFSGSGSYWISTVHSGHPADAVDPTALIVRFPKDAPMDKRPAAVQVVELGPGKGWSRRCNLIEPLSLFVRIERAGRYRVDHEGVLATHRFESFMITPPADYRPPANRQSGAVWLLDAGYYVLSVEPQDKGIATLTLRPERMKTVPQAPHRASVRFPVFRLASGQDYVLYLSRQPEVEAGVILRKLPLDLTEPLPLALASGEMAEVPFTAAEPGVLSARDDAGAPLDVSVDGGPWRTEAEVDPGSHRAAVRQQGQEIVLGSLSLLPVRLSQTAPLPPLPDTALASLPRVPEIAEGKPQFLDLARESRQTFLMHAERDALYRLEATGLLETEGTLRSRVVTSLASSKQGGTGRNFLLHQYLRSGDYQVAVATRGHSAGHLGLALTRTEPLAGGVLMEGIPARAALGAGEAIAYTFTITEPGEYRLRTLGLDKTFRCRLEDADGWPIARPGITADITRRFEPGSYRLFLLPDPVASRRVTLLTRIVPPLKFEGHGPHKLPMNTRVEHTWLEPEAGAPRIPDSWEIDMPAAAEVQVALGGEMRGRIVRLPEGTPGSFGVAVVRPWRGWRGTLPEGRYRLEVAASRPNNRLPYVVEIRPQSLVAGTEQAVTTPARISLAVGQSGLTEITSFGDKDVRASLYDEADGLIAASDDRDADWNFHIAARLKPGRYTLTVYPVGSGEGETTVRMEARPEIPHPALSLPASLRLDPGAEVHLFPLSPSSSDLLLAAAASQEAVGLAIEVEHGGAWRTVASEAGRQPRLALALPAGPARLRVWSVDRRGDAVQLSAMPVSAPRIDEASLAKGIHIAATPGSHVAPALLQIERPGALRITGEGVRAARHAGEPLEPLRHGVATADGAALWLALDAPTGEVQLQGSRVELSDQPLQVTVSDAATLDFSAKGLALVLTSSAERWPLARVLGAGDKPADLSSGRSVNATAVAPHASAAVGLVPGRAAAQVWLAGSQPADVQVRRLSFPRPEPTTIPFGVIEGVLRGPEAKAYTLPEGVKRVRLASTAGVVAAVASGDRIESVHWAGDEPLAEVFETSGQTLYLLHSGTGESRFSVELLPALEAAILNPAGPFEEVMPRAGTRRLPVVGGSGEIENRGCQRPVRVFRRANSVRAANPSGRVGRHAVPVARAGARERPLARRPYIRAKRGQSGLPPGPDCLER